jgi:hypothetical protein
MIPEEWSSVQSTNIDQVKYDLSAHELHVQFKNGGYYIYTGVPVEDAEEIYHASSPGSYLRSNIIGVYPHRRA